MPKPKLQLRIGKDVLKAVDDFVVSRPGYNISVAGSEALEAALKKLESKRIELVMPAGGILLKPAGKPFPQRLSDPKPGRPPEVKARPRGELGKMTVYINEDLMNRFKNAVFWLRSVPVYFVEDALRSHYLPKSMDHARDWGR